VEKCKTEDLRVQSKQGENGEPVDFVFDGPVCPW